MRQQARQEEQLRREQELEVLRMAEATGAANDAARIAQQRRDDAIAAGVEAGRKCREEMLASARGHGGSRSPRAPAVPGDIPPEEHLVADSSDSSNDS